MIGPIYWVCWLLVTIGGSFVLWGAPPVDMGLFVLVQVMLFLLGWKLLGWPITGKTE